MKCSFNNQEIRQVNTMNETAPEFLLSGIVIDCKDAGNLGSFYQRLLGWTMISDDNGWFELQSPDGLLLNFQTDDAYEPPVWPSEAGKQGQMQHLDFYVKDLDAAVSYAIRLGARTADQQFFQANGCIALIDPEGHPFCVIRKIA